MSQIGATVPLAAQAARDVPGKAAAAVVVSTTCKVSLLHVLHIRLHTEGMIWHVPGVRPEGPDSNDLDVQAAEAGAPATFFCPISFRCFRDPVLLSTGQT